MDPATPSDPGFGWATSKRRLVTLDENGRFVTESDMTEGFPSSFPCNFVREFCAKKSIEFPFTNEEFSATIKDVLTSYLSSHNLLEEYDEFCKTGKSNNRAMKWDIMTITPNTSFKLHAHPNIEIIYVIQGAIHEYRYEVQLLDQSSSSKRWYNEIAHCLHKDLFSLLYPLNRRVQRWSNICPPPICAVRTSVKAFLGCSHTGAPELKNVLMSARHIRIS